LNILALDSSSVTASVAVCKDDVVLAEGFVNNGLTHSQTLLPLVRDTLQKSGLTISMIDRFAMANGPGSFTGLRIGGSLIKGMAAVDNTSCAGVSTLEALAFGIREHDGILCPVMDARCGQVYHSLYQCLGGVPKRITEDSVIPIDALCDRLNNLGGHVILVGDGAVLCYNSMKEKLPDLFLPEGEEIYLKAKSIAQLALHKNEWVSPDRLAPVYLQLPQAERELKRKRDGIDSIGL